MRTNVLYLSELAPQNILIILKAFVDKSKIILNLNPQVSSSILVTGCGIALNARGIYRTAVQWQRKRSWQQAKALRSMWLAQRRPVHVKQKQTVVHSIHQPADRHELCVQLCLYSHCHLEQCFITYLGADDLVSRIVRQGCKNVSCIIQWSDNTKTSPSLTELLIMH